MKDFNRRNFIKMSGLSVLPVLATAVPLLAVAEKTDPFPDEADRVYFINDGPLYKPTEYIAKLQEINKGNAIERDFYGDGGHVDKLLKKFISITGKQAAIYMPSGTMANQLAIHVLSGENSKVFVQETSHVYRDEADAAQSTFNKRLIPLGKAETGFTVEELQQAIAYHDQGEVFKSGIGAISIEIPNRRTDGAMMTIDEIKKISGYCRKNGYKLHLDGARIYMAVAWSGISVAEYASYFDTIYISLYKYLGAAGGAVLCGDKEVIGKMTHLVKVHGGAVFTNWANAAMALHHVEGFEDRLKRSIEKSKELFASLNQLPEIKINPLKNGTNIYMFSLSNKIDSPKFSKLMREKYNIIIGQRRDDGTIRLMVNESLLIRDNNYIIESIKSALKEAII